MVTFWNVEGHILFNQNRILINFQTIALNKKRRAIGIINIALIASYLRNWKNFPLSECAVDYFVCVLCKLSMQSVCVCMLFILVGRRHRRIQRWRCILCLGQRDVIVYLSLAARHIYITKGLLTRFRRHPQRFSELYIICYVSERTDATDQARCDYIA